MNLLRGLDDEQKKAVTLETNGIAAAGAGSGKTRVLASRYAWLVAEKNLAPDEILTLTFTNKAVSEMYSRIYRYLLESANSGSERAANALKNFHKARISTLDAFSAGIARTASARYGISADFTSDDAGLRDIAGEAALRFVLDHREAPAIRELLVDHKIRTIASEIFAQVVIKYSPISSPLDLDELLLAQKEAILLVWREKSIRLESLTGKITEALHTLAELKKSISLTVSLGEILLKSPPPPLPDIGLLLETDKAAAAGRNEDLPSIKTREQLKKYFDYYSALVASRIPGRYGDDYTPLVEYFIQLKGRDGDGLYHDLESIANYACSFGLCAGIFELIKKFQDEFNVKKRETGFLSFSDIARLAVDALRDHPDIRNVYKDAEKMIMIDEFQDNNALQRDLIYLLAENSDRSVKGIAGPEELQKNRMFFVGDEKQSIYRFRGADVAVFRSLGKSFHGLGETIEMSHNYRSGPGLIAAFNHIFGQVFLPADSADYEAVYSGIKPPENSDGENAADKAALVHFCFLNGGDLDDDGREGIRPHDLEAVFIAKKIRDMVLNKETIPGRTDGGIKPLACKWSDFAVLQRSYTHQSSLEKYFREFGIPYNTDRPSGLFNDAPILDLRAYLRLLVYPEDRIAYSALIRSPFMRLSDRSLAVCMLASNAEPFAEENEPLIPQEDIALYRRARERYRSLCEASRSVSITELITKLWYEEGYRYETLWTEQAQVYENLFDLFFSLACDAEASGKNLAAFIDYLEDVMNREEKPDDRDLPGEGEAGVRIMSIHKSKGLECPVVFIFDCARSGNMRNNQELLSYHEKFGLILKIPQAEELPLGGNYFLNIIEEEEKSKDTAELRRLLYVAMTRAESRLFLTFTLPAQTKEEKKEWDMGEEDFNEDSLRRRLFQLADKAVGRETFLSLLGPVLPACPSSLCTLETIPVLSRAEISRMVKQGGFTKQSGMASQNTQREAALASAPFYEKAEMIPEGRAFPVSLEASRLKAPGHALDETASSSAPLRSGAEYDSILEKADLGPADFGTIVHAVLEARFTGYPCKLPPKIKSRMDDVKFSKEIMAYAETLADGFLSSELGKRCSASPGRESEFSIITSAGVNGKPIVIMGQIDLLFEEEGEVVAVDFKTDKIERPEDHYGQLAVYYQAASDIFGKPASVWLFYLRSGRALDVTAEVKSLSLDEIAGHSFAVQNP